LKLDPITLCLVGCGKAKLSRRAKAKALYTGNLFRAARAWAENCDEWRIVSARYGLVDPETVLSPYEHRLEPKEAAQWGQAVANSIIGEFLECGPVTVVILAGEDYAHPIMSGLRASGDTWRCNIVDVVAPLRGLGLGKRLAWLADDSAWLAQRRSA
jgi:hypothetical protein